MDGDQDIARETAGLEERPWAEWGKGGKPLTSQALRSLLEEFKIYSSHKLDKTARGYKRDAFADAWARVPAARRRTRPSNSGSIRPSVRNSDGAQDSREPASARRPMVGTDPGCPRMPLKKSISDGWTDGPPEPRRRWPYERRCSLGPAAARRRIHPAQRRQAVVRAPTGRLTPDLAEELRHRKPLLVAILAGDHCRYCEDAIDWRRPHAVAFADGTGAHLACYEEAEVARLLEAGRRAVESPDALADPAEAMLKRLV